MKRCGMVGLGQGQLIVLRIASCAFGILWRQKLLSRGRRALEVTCSGPLQLCEWHYGILQTPKPTEGVCTSNMACDKFKMI